MDSSLPPKPADLDQKAEDLARRLEDASQEFAALGVHVGRTTTRFRPSAGGWHLVIAVRRDGVDGVRECALAATGDGTSAGELFDYALVPWWGDEWSLANFQALPLYDPAAPEVLLA